jgi:hypothetical protein
LGKHRLEIPNEVGIFCLARNHYFMVFGGFNIEAPNRNGEADFEAIQETME